MHKAVRILLTTVIVGGAAAGCATSEQWAEWRQHSSHFASGSHLVFSFRHRGEDSAAPVTRRDLERSSAQSWWGDAVIVRADQVVETPRDSR